MKKCQKSRDIASLTKTQLSTDIAEDNSFADVILCFSLLYRYSLALLRMKPA